MVEVNKHKTWFSLLFTRKMVPQGPPTWPPTESCAHLSGNLKAVIISTSNPKVGMLCNTLKFFTFLLPSTMELKPNLKGLLLCFLVEVKKPQNVFHCFYK